MFDSTLSSKVKLIVEAKSCEF